MENKKRIVIIGDSLGMPRPFDGIKLENTYPYLLAASLSNFEIICKCRRANDSQKEASGENDLNDDINFLEPDFVVLHFGIVDCAPRLFTKTQNLILNKFPKSIHLPIIKFFSKNRFFYTRIFKKVYVEKHCYQKNMEKIIERVYKVNAIPIIINIADTNLKNKNKSYGFKKNIQDYNAILSILCETYRAPLVDIYSQSTVNNILLQDGIHLNNEGNKWLADTIKEKILSVNNNIEIE